MTEPLIPTGIPRNPWENIHVDLYGPLPDGNYVFGIIDETARCPEVAVLRSATSADLIKSLDTVFVSDNGSQFTSEGFRSFLKEIGSQQRLVTPYWPRANGEIEQFFRNVGKVIRGCVLQGRDHREGLQTFVRSYRMTPHASTGVAPAKLMLRYEPRTKLPGIERQVRSKDMRQAQQKDRRSKVEMK